ncbi:MAG: hypothetical protein GEU93_12670 [Propionibacteriales bacterium]|nr:hypothetical protein [Propionibacteriales bacterium]
MAHQNHRHSWQTRSTHRTLEGLLHYQHCACGRWRVAVANGAAVEVGATRPDRRSLELVRS